MSAVGIRLNQIIVCRENLSLDKRKAALKELLRKDNRRIRINLRKAAVYKACGNESFILKIPRKMGLLPDSILPVCRSLKVPEIFRKGAVPEQSAPDYKEI